MSRIMARPRRKEGRGIGERIAESVVYVVIVGALIYGVQWYFLVYSRSPGPALQSYINAVKSGNVQRQYEMLSARYRAQWPLAEYDDKNPLAHNLTERIASFAITNLSIVGERADADVALQVRRTGQELYQASTDVYHDHYVLVRETDGWKVALDDPKTKLESANAPRPAR